MTDDRQFVAVPQIMTVSFFEPSASDEDRVGLFSGGKQEIFFKIIISFIFAWKIDMGNAYTNYYCAAGFENAGHCLQIKNI